MSGIFLCRKWREPARREALDRNPNRIAYTSKAICLMACQQVQKEEIKRIIKKGVILLNKSNKFGRPCPTFAVQGSFKNGKSLRVMLEQCKQETRVLSCSIVNLNMKCECPGDKK
jgi:hypothetical protein